MHNIRRKLFSQNFLSNRALIAQLVTRSSIGKNDLVVEIGPGKGSITEVLVQQAGHVIAVEIDRYWYQYLQKKFEKTNNLTLNPTDFLNFSLPRMPYKVFANTPFAIEGKIIRKLIEATIPPQDCYLVVMRELAERLVAENTVNMFSVMHQPWFDFSITHSFNPEDFSPVPSVNPVLFRFVRKKQPLLDVKQRQHYYRFVQHGFGTGQAVRQTLRTDFSIPVIDQALHKLSISRQAKPSQLQLPQWLALYRILCPN